MDTKKIIIIGIIIVAIAVIGCYFLLNNQSNLDQPFLISKSAYIKVPVSNATHKPDNHGVYYYVDNQNGINVTSCNSNISKESSVSVIKNLKDSAISSSKMIKEEDVIIYEKNGVYSIFFEDMKYNNTIIIQSLSKDLLLSCWKTLRIHDPNEVIKVDDTSSAPAINAVEETQSAIGTVSTPSSSSSSSSSVDTSYTTSGSSWSYGGYASGGGKSSDYGEYDFSV